MKNIKYSALVAIAAIAASCAKESTVIEKETIKDIPMEPMCIQTGDESETKTSLNGQTVNWTEGDQIAVYSNMDYSKGYKFSATNIKDINRNTATFSGEVPAGTESFFAVYPPERVSSASASGAVVNIPSDQTPAEGTFGEELNITIAKGTKIPGTPNVGTIHFRNVCSYVKFTVPAYVSDVNFVKISSENAIAGKLTVDYTGENPSSEIAADGAKSISMSGSFGKGKTFIFVIAPGTISNFQIDIKTASGKNWTRTIRTGFTATAGKPVNLRTVDFKIASMTATVNHTYEGEGETKTLTGTNLVIDNLNIPDGLTGYVQKVHIDIIPEGKTTAVRSADITDFSNQNSIAVNSKEYPYLPKGKYTIKSTYTMSDGTTSRETTCSFSVSAPEFGVEVSAYTSYDKYLVTDINAANKCTAETIYDVSGKAMISESILGNANYASLVSALNSSYAYSVDNGTQSGNTFTGCAWGERTLTANCTFDGATMSGTRACQITGLPYRAPSEIAFNATGKSWTKVNGKKTSVEASKITLRTDTGTPIQTPEIKSPLFYIPSDNTIACNINGNYTLISYKLLIWYTTTFTLFLNDTTIVSQEGAKASSTQYTLNKDVTLSSSANSFSATSSYNTGKNVYATIETFNIIYK